jgi:uncharacterized zinc-type alcohol dehydrogenase-like protein
MPLEKTAPLLCAGITTYSPLNHWKIKKGDKVGIVGLGGLGHVAVKLAAAMEATVVVLSTSESKKADALALKANDFILLKDANALASVANSFDLILDTVSADHDIPSLINLLKKDGKYVFVGAPNKPLNFYTFPLLFKRVVITGSLIGGIKETQSMLDFCAKHNITSDVEVIKINQVNEAYERVLKSDVKYRFVIDMNSL